MSNVRHKSYWGPALMIGGGLAAVGGALFAYKKSSDVADAVERAVDAPPVALPPSQATIDRLPTFKARLTGYYPLEAKTAAQKKMEGGVKDRVGRPLIYIEDHLRDPVTYPYFSIAGDWNVFPYGQRVQIDAWPNAVGRIVDTGGNFFGLKKMYRISGAEPLDIAQRSSAFKKPTTALVRVIPGDTLVHTLAKRTGPKDVVTSGLKGQNVTLSGVLEGRTSADCEALARAIESELGGRPREEQVAAAWAIRNRADETGVSIEQLLAPHGEWGAPSRSGGYASTRKVPTDIARQIAREVLESDADPTAGAVEFWLPEEQTRLHQLGQIYRAARQQGDERRARQYARYARYGSEGDVRVAHAREGLGVVHVIGGVELLARRRT